MYSFSSVDNEQQQKTLKKLNIRWWIYFIINIILLYCTFGFMGSKFVLAMVFLVLTGIFGSFGVMTAIVKQNTKLNKPTRGGVQGILSNLFGLILVPTIVTFIVSRIRPLFELVVGVKLVG